MGIFGPNIKKMEQKRDIEGLVKALQHNKSSIRESAAFALDRLGWDWRASDNKEKAYYLATKKEWNDLTELGEPAVDPLLLALHDAVTDYDRKVKDIKSDGRNDLEGSQKNFEVLIEGLARIGEPAVDPGIRALEDALEDYRIRFETTKKHDPKHINNVSRTEIEVLEEVLGRIGEPSIEPIIHTFKVKDRFLAVRVLKNVGEPAVEPLIQLLEDEDKTVQDIAISALGYIGDGKAIKPLVRFLNDETKNVYARAEAALSLGRINDERAVEPLLWGLKNPKLSIRTSSAVGLDYLSWAPNNDSERVYYLFAVMLIHIRGEFYIRKDEWDELIVSGGRAVEPLIQSFIVEDQVKTGEGSVYKGFGYDIINEVGYLALNALVEIGEPAVEPLKQTIRDQNNPIRIREMSAFALGEIKDARAKEALVQALKDENEEVRKAAEKALKRIK